MPSMIHPVAVIGAGPVGLAAAAHLVQRGQPVRVFEAGETVAAHVRDWGHVQLFTPWAYAIDAAARALLERTGWRAPEPEIYSTGHELVARYLEPLAATPEIHRVLETDARIVAISRRGTDKVTSHEREARPFSLRVADGTGRQRRVLASAVLDTSGTWGTPNPLGADGLSAEGEEAAIGRIAYGIPDVLGRDRVAYAGKATVVVGAGHSAAHVLLDLARLAEAVPGTSLIWATRGTDLSRVYGGGAADQLAARGALGTRLHTLVAQGTIQLQTGFAVAAVREIEGRLGLESEAQSRLGPVDRIVVATGQRPDLSLTRELRVELDPWLESARALGPMIDPNLHSCGSVPPHGHRELSHPEPGFYIAGIKSYGRAPTFLMMTGYEQVRSIAAALAGDRSAADDVHLVLPETGVCTVDREAPAPASCCAPKPEVKSCCGTAA